MKNKNFGRKRQAIYILSNRKSTRIIKTLMDFFFFIKVKIKMVCFSVPSLAMGEGDVDFDGIFETLREIDFANRQLRADAPKVGGDNIACVSMFGFPEKMEKQAPEARERIERELLSK